MVEWLMNDTAERQCSQKNYLKKKSEICWLRLYEMITISKTAANMDNVLMLFSQIVQME